MAYGIKYQVDWQSPMRDKRIYRVSILERDYEGEVYPLYPTGDFITITRGNIDDDEFEPIRSSEAKLTLLCVDEGDPYLSLFTTDAMKYKLVISVPLEGFVDSWISIWEGYLSTSSYSQPYSPVPYKISLSAVDGLALLKGVPFVDEGGAQYSGRKTLSLIVGTILRSVSDNPILYYPIDKIRPLQAGHTMDELALEMETIYSSLGSNVTSYDVLSAILRTLRLSIHQSASRWSIRSIVSQNMADRPTSGAWWNNGGEPIPLYSDAKDDRGVSVKATLSLLPPYREMKVSRPTLEETKINTKSMLSAVKWRRLFHSFSLSKYEFKDAIRLESHDPASISGRFRGGYYIMDGSVSVGANVTLSLNASLYSLSHVEKTATVGIYLTDALPSEIVNLLTLNTAFTMREWYGWNGENNAWEKMNLLPDLHDELFHGFTTVPLEPSKYQRIDIPCDPSALKATSLNITTTPCPAFTNANASVRLVVVLAGVGSSLPAIELRDPQIVFKQENTISTSDDIKAVTIADTGLGTIEYNQQFADTQLDVGTGYSYDAPLLEVASGRVLRGLVVPSQNSSLLDSAISEVRFLRGTPVRQIDGEVNSGIMIDLDALWVDREGRKYYTNYISHKLRRGIDLVQLRELPASASLNMVPKAKLSAKNVGSVVGLDTSAYIATQNNRSVVRYDARNDVFHDIIASVTGTYPLTLNEGLHCASIVSYDGTWYNLYAYDTDGNLISKIEKVNSYARMSGKYVDIVIRAARYDATLGMWVMVGGDAVVMYTWLLSRDGAELVWEVVSISDYTSPSNFVLIPNGYARTRVVDNIQEYSSFWRSYTQHADASPVTLYKKNAQVVYASEKLLIQKDDTIGYFIVYGRSSSLLGVGETQLGAFGLSNATFVGANNAFAVFKDARRKMLLISDARGSSTHTISLDEDFEAAEKLWLSSETIYGLVLDNGVYKIIAYNIRR